LQNLQQIHCILYLNLAIMTAVFTDNPAACFWFRLV